MAGAESSLGNNPNSSSRARSGEPGTSCSGEGCRHSNLQDSSPPPKRKRIKLEDSNQTPHHNSKHQNDRHQSDQQNTATSVMSLDAVDSTLVQGSNPSSEVGTSNDSTIPGAHPKESDADDGVLSASDGGKRRLKLHLTHFLNGELDYAGILREVLPLTRELYALSRFRMHCQ